MQFKNSKHCTVLKGEWVGAYTGKVFTKASDVDIDHTVPQHMCTNKALESLAGSSVEDLQMILKFNSGIGIGESIQIGQSTA